MITSASLSPKGAAGDYYTLLLDISTDLSLGENVGKFEEMYGSSAPDITHQLILQSATQSSSETLKELAENMLTLATRAIPTQPYVYPQASLGCSIEQRTVLQVFMLWRSRPKLSPKTASVDQMLYFQHSRRSCPSKPKERQVGVALGTLLQTWTSGTFSESC